MAAQEHVERLLSAAVHEALLSSPVVAVTGPRTAGKSTLVRELITASGGTFIDLDDPVVRTLAAADPTAFVRGLAEPVAIDEFQRVPDLLASIKAELNIDRRPGRFVLAGSARHDVAPELGDYLTGRVELLTLWPFAAAELQQGARTMVDRLLDGSLLDERGTAATSRAEIVEVVLRGGYPIAVGLPAAARARWFANLATLVAERIADDTGMGGRPATIGRFLRLVAARSAQLATAAEIGRDAGLGRDQAAHYLRLLELAYLAIRLPAWSTNLSARLTKRPKTYLVDSGLAAHLQGVTAERLSPIDPAAATRFGALLETFVVGEIVKQLGWSAQVAEPFHYRGAGGVEVDVVLETSDGRVAAIEVKAGSQVSRGATAGLEHLRDALGARFVAGVVLHTGGHTQRVGDRIAVAPVDALWTARDQG